TATDWIAIDAGDVHTCGIRDDGSLWCWGANDARIGVSAMDTNSPVEVPVPPGADEGGGGEWVAVATGSTHTCGIAFGTLGGQPASTLWCWGLNGAGQLGTNDQQSHGTPTEVGTATEWTRVSAGGLHTCATSAPGTLWCFGANTYGQLG